VKQINNGDGVPLLAELGELRLLRQLNDASRKKYSFLKNSMLSQKMETLATMFHDLKITSEAIENAVGDQEISEKMEIKYGEFHHRILTISDKFYHAIQNLDLNAANVNGTADAANQQFDAAIKAYKEGASNGFLPGKFLREFRTLEKANPLVSCII
jgi:hypothetical protein